MEMFPWVIFIFPYEYFLTAVYFNRVVLTFGSASQIYIRP